jgi:outer membrane protein assembly factor BamB
VGHHNESYIAVVRFEAAGSFAWTHEWLAASVAGIAFVPRGRIAMTGHTHAGAPIYVRVYDAATGDLVWDREVGVGERFGESGYYDFQQLVVDANGNLMILTSENGDYVVMRLDPDGNALPTWRSTIDSKQSVVASAILALPDGGAILAGRYSGHGGYVTVRLDAQGNEIFRDVEPGEIGSTLGPSFLLLDADENVVVAGSPESTFGLPHARVWKLSPTGTRLWTKGTPNPDASRAAQLKVSAFASNGDILIGVDSPFRLVRLAAATGDVIWDVKATIDGNLRTLALAPNGRVLAGGYKWIEGKPNGRIAEFEASGRLCRVAESVEPFTEIGAAANGDGWSELGTTRWVESAGNDVLLRKYDADGGCTLPEHIFVDDFERP